MEHKNCRHFSQKAQSLISVFPEKTDFRQPEGTSLTRHEKYLLSDSDNFLTAAQ